MNLAIVSTNKDKYSETFIHNHIRLLPATIHFLFDGYLPKQYSVDKGITSHSILDLKKKSFKNLFKTEQEEHLSSIERYLVKNKIDVILCEYGPSGTEMMHIAERLNIPLVVHFHGYDAYRDDILSSYGKKYLELFQIACAIIVVSKHMYTQLIKLGCPENKLHCIVYGIDTTIFKNSINQLKEPLFISCGRFVEKKSPQSTIKAFKLVLRESPNAKLIMIGDGELLQECKNLVQELNISQSVEFKGVQIQKQIAQLYNQALAFIQHSVTTHQNDSEGTPLTIMEAMCSGLAVVSTKHAGIVDVITDGYTGFMIDENDIETMAKHMIFLLENPERALKLGEAASQFITSNHTLEIYTQRLWKVIENAKK